MTQARPEIPGLPQRALARIDALARALDRIDVEDLPLYVARVRQPRHRRAVESAELVAIGAGLAEPLLEARRTMVQGLARRLAQGEFRVMLGGVRRAPADSLDAGVRISQSLADAVTAIVLDDALDADIRAELLGRWDRLLP